MFPNGLEEVVMREGSDRVPVLSCGGGPGTSDQVDGGWTYLIQYGPTSALTTLAEVVATSFLPVTILCGSSSSSTAGPNQEFWYANSAAIAGLPAVTSLIITPTAISSTNTVTLPSAFSTATPNFTGQTTAVWGGGPAPTSQAVTAYFFSGVDAISAGTLGIELLVSSSNTIVGVAWYLFGSAPSSGVQPSGTYVKCSSGPQLCAATSTWPLS
jgi:hypothetical protein